MLILPKHVADGMIAHALRESPLEACGIVSGRPGGGEGQRLIEMRNVAQSATAYAFDPVEQVTVWRALDAAGEKPIVIYHSHTATAAVPSRVDVAYACDRQAHYVVVSTRDPTSPEVRSWRITGDNDAHEEQIFYS